MEFELSRSIEVLSAAPATLRSLLEKLSREWTSFSDSASDNGVVLSDTSPEKAKRPGQENHPPAKAVPLLRTEGNAEQIQNLKSKIQNQEWQPFDIIGHLIHGEKTDWIPRARIILGQGENLTFVPFDRFAQFENSKGKSVTQLLDEFAALRAENISTLRSWKLTDDQLALEGIHPELGRVTLRQLLATWVVHDLNHVRQIVTTMAKRYDSEVGVWKEYLSILQ